MTRVLLLRHGQSTWNAEGRWQGRADPPLSAGGRAAVIAAVGGTHPPAALADIVAAVTSDQRRARETAGVVAAQLGWGPVDAFPGLRERDVGAFTGLTRAEIEQRWPGLLDGPGPIEPPGAEPRLALVARAIATLHRIAERHPGQAVLAVTHGALIRAVEAHLGVLRAGPPGHLSGRWLVVERGRVRPGDEGALVPSSP